ncbi:uncharacterized protein LOC121878123 [Homarus americanus]|uniref:uncharacterized protein LOC121878123 n=1 Tax=Homarus americanus TaxID=6706 RepID=UPI001C460C7B|nr:uncharacterized protein LOC121878123 [Homarus americanus]
MSAQYLLKPNMKLFSRDLFFLKDTMKLPTAKNLLGIAGNLSIFLSIQVVPLPSIGEVIARLVKLLHLPESIKELAQEVLECDGTFLKPSGVNIPTIEVLAMASIIVVLKLNCGIDDNQEFQLSRAAARINAEFQPHNIISPLFSWDEWERYINRVLWFCSQVDPVCALHCQKWDQLFRMDSSQISRFYWTEGVWRNPQTIMKPDKIRQSVTWKLLYNQNQSIDKILNAPSAFKATQQPFMSIIEQFLDQHRGDNSIQEMVKVAEDLTKQSFSDHYLDWTDNICGLQRKLQKCNSNIIIQPEKVIKNNSENNSASKCKDHSKNARDISLGDSSLLGKKRKRSRETKDVVIIPQPLKHVWKVEFARGTSKWKSTFSDLPCSFKWLICLGCLVCETTEEELFYNVVKLDNSCKKVEINSCKNVERKNSCKKVERTNSCKKVERKKKKKLEDSHLHIPSIKSPWEP